MKINKISVLLPILRSHFPQPGNIASGKYPAKDFRQNDEREYMFYSATNEFSNPDLTIDAVKKDIESLIKNPLLNLIINNRNILNVESTRLRGALADKESDVVGSTSNNIRLEFPLYDATKLNILFKDGNGSSYAEIQGMDKFIRIDNPNNANELEQKLGESLSIAKIYYYAPTLQNGFIFHYSSRYHAIVIESQNSGLFRWIKTDTHIISKTSNYAGLFNDAVTNFILACMAKDKALPFKLDAETLKEPEQAVLEDLYIETQLEVTQPIIDNLVTKRESVNLTQLHATRKDAIRRLEEAKRNLESLDAQIKTEEMRVILSQPEAKIPLKGIYNRFVRNPLIRDIKFEKINEQAVVLTLETENLELTKYDAPQLARYFTNGQRASYAGSDRLGQVLKKMLEKEAHIWFGRHKITLQLQRNGSGTLIATINTEGLDNYTNPHAFIACLGSYEQVITKALEQREYENVLYLTLEYLQSITVGDGGSSYLTRCAYATDNEGKKIFDKEN